MVMLSGDQESVCVHVCVWKEGGGVEGNEHLV